MTPCGRSAAHVCVLMIDAREKLNRQDLAIARLVAEEGRAMVIAANMWDVVRDRQDTLEELQYRLDQSLGQVRCAAHYHVGINRPWCRQTV